MNRRRLFLVSLMTVLVCLNPVPALAQWWDGWFDWDDGYYEYEYSSYEEYYDLGPVYYYQPAPAPLVIGFGGCNKSYDD